MPLVFQKNYSWGLIAVWKIEEDEYRLGKIVSPSDLESIAGIRSLTRRVERLAWRALLRSVVPNLGSVVYDNYGAPHVEGVELSVSHNREYAAIAVSSGARCAIDIELCNRNFERVVGRYISKDEEIIIGLSSLNSNERQRALCAVWCAKEVLYKYSIRDNLDFVNNLKIRSYSNSYILGAVITEGEAVELSMDVLDIGGSLLVVGASTI